MLQNTPRGYSLLDPELPLLAVDAAYEIDIYLTTSKALGLNTMSFDDQFKNTADLINRLSIISASTETVTPDRQLYVQSLLPCIEASNIDLPSEPILLSKKLNEIIKTLGKEGTPSELPLIRDFFISLSNFSSNMQCWSRSGSSSHPYATL